MVKINGSDFEIYPDDTVESVKLRIAALHETLPEYLYFPQGEPPTLQDFGVDIEVRDVKTDLARENVDFPEICGKIADKSTCLSLYFVSHGSVLSELTDIERNLVLHGLALEPGVKPLNVEELNKLWEDRDQMRAVTERQIKKNQMWVNKLKKFRELKPLPMTAFVPENVTYALTIDLSHPHSLLEVFDRLVLRPEAPFAGTTEFYKILKDSVPSVDWVEEVQPQEMVIAVDGTQALGTGEYVRVSACLIDNDQECTSELASRLLVAMKFSPSEITANTIKDRVFGAEGVLLAGANEYATEGEETELSGVFYICLGTVQLNRDIFADLLMNDEQFRNYLSTDESTKATKEASTTHIQFGIKDTPTYIAANITPKVAKIGTFAQMTKQKYVVGDELSDKFQPGQHFLRVNIKYANDLQSVGNFKHKFGQLMALYIKRAPTVLKEYRKLLGKSFGVARKAKPSAEGTPDTRIGNIAPEITIGTHYTKKCQKQFQPRVVARQEAEQLEAAGRQVMAYPKTTDMTVEFPQRLYTCDNKPSNPYPGLKINTEGSGPSHFPCCYTKDQRVDGTSYAAYLKGVKRSRRGYSEQQSLAARDVFMDPLLQTKVGILLPEIQTILDSLISRKHWEFVRSGVFDSKSSFLDCVITALGLFSQETEWGGPRIEGLSTYSTEAVVAANRELLEAEKQGKGKHAKEKIEKKKNDAELVERLEKMRDLRQELSESPASRATCRQEMYDFTEEEIGTWLADSDQYLDPKFFTNLLETHFECNIFLFSKVQRPDPQRDTYQKASEARLVLPRHIQAYYNTPKKGPCILLYEHLGRKGAAYPRCEIVGYWNKQTKEEVLWAFPEGGGLCKSLRGVYEALRLSYALDKRILETVFLLPDLQMENVKLQSQVIDVYGKCRQLNFTSQGKKGTIITTPIQPVNLPVDATWKVDLPEGLARKVAGKGANRENSGFSTTFGNVEVFVPFEGKEVVENEPSQLTEYSRYSKLAGYLVEYMRWLYSQYIDEMQEDISLESMVVFANTRVKIVPDFDYGPVPRNFSVNSGVMEEGKLIVKSVEALKRLLFTLRLYCQQQPAKLTAYKDRMSIVGYYTEASDFTAHRSQVVLQGNISVQQWIEERNQERLLYSGVRPYLESTPYFLRNTKIDKNVLLVQPIVTAEHDLALQYAYEVSEDWSRESFNNYDQVKEKEQTNIAYDFTLYSYKNRRDITTYACDTQMCQNEENPGDQRPRILGYKDSDNTPIFTALLSLGK